MQFTNDQLKTIYAMAMGYGTEAAVTPYKLTVCASRWGNSSTVIAKAGYSIGVIQYDFGAQGDQAKAKATEFVNDVLAWAGGRKFSEAKEIIIQKLATRGQGIQWVVDSDRQLFDEYLAVPANQSNFFTKYEAPLMDKFLFGTNNIWGSANIITDSRYANKFAGMTDGDQLRVLTMLDKIVNQAGAGKLDDAYGVLGDIPANQFNADNIREKLLAAFPTNDPLQRGIIQADCAGEVIAAISQSPFLSGLLEAGNGVSAFDSATVAANPDLMYLSTLLGSSVARVRKEGNTEYFAANPKILQFINAVDADTGGALFVKNGSAIGITEEGDRFVINTKTMQGFKETENGWTATSTGSQLIKRSADGRKWILSLNDGSELPIADIDQPIQLGDKEVYLASNETIILNKDGDVLRVSSDGTTYYAEMLMGDLEGYQLTYNMSGQNLNGGFIVNAAYSSDPDLSSLQSGQSVTFTIEDGVGNSFLRTVARLDDVNGMQQGYQIIEAQRIDGQVQWMTTTDISASGDETITFAGTIDGRDVRITFDQDYIVTNAVFIDSIGQEVQPVDKALLISNLNAAEITPDMLRYTASTVNIGGPDAGIDARYPDLSEIDIETGHPYGLVPALEISGLLAESDPAEQIKPITNLFIATNTMPTGTTQQGASDQQIINSYLANNNLFYNGITSIYSETNGENTSVNTDRGAPALANFMMTGGYMPGNNNTGNVGSLNYFTVDPSLIPSPQYNAAQANTASTWLAYNLAPTDPLILDLNGDGVKLTDYGNDGVLFDADHDGGSLEQTGWASREDGIVVKDVNGNGRIDDISETLSEYFGGTIGTGGSAGTKPYRDGFAALKSLDSNGDNIFNASDTQWNNVKVWVDANHDGKSWVDTNGNEIFDACAMAVGR